MENESKRSQVKKRVRQLLKEKEATRDSDFLLFITYWIDQLGSKYNENVRATFRLLFAEFKAGNLTLPDDISRARRKLQQLEPEIRGKLWDVRQERANKLRKNKGTL